MESININDIFQPNEQIHIANNNDLEYFRLKVKAEENNINYNKFLTQYELLEDCIIIYKLQGK